MPRLSIKISPDKDTKRGMGDLFLSENERNFGIHKWLRIRKGFEGISKVKFPAPERERRFIGYNMKAGNGGGFDRQSLRASFCMELVILTSRAINDTTIVKLGTNSEST